MGDGPEFDTIRRLLATWGPAAEGIGDDAAVLAVPPGERLVASTDATIEGVHFRREWMTPEEIGSRAAAAALSDLAAMAAVPLGLLLAIAAPPDWGDELEALARGVGAVAHRARCPIVGGNLSAARELSLTITVLGSTARPLGRSGAVAGDVILVTGELGGPGAALAALLAGAVPDPRHATRFVSPAPRLLEARWLAEHGAHAAIDISDGLVADAAHLARASGVSFQISADRIPLVGGVSASEAAASGEEYELIVAMPAPVGGHAAAFARQFGIPLTAIGIVLPASAEPVTLTGPRTESAAGHDHFSSRA